MSQSGSGGGGSGIGTNHTRVLHTTAVTVDRLLADIEALASQGESPLRRYKDDLTAVQKQVLIAFTRAAHARMVAALAQLGVPPPTPSGSARASARNALTFADIALQEAEPSLLRGYGALTPQAEAAIERMLADVAATLATVRDFLGESVDVDLAQRIARLDHQVAEKAELLRLEQTIRDRGLVSLRRPLQVLVEQAESGSYEIAVFGRVSSGKSSLLNAVLELPLLPVGITPVTSVPTRLVWGESPTVVVRFADATKDQHFPVGELEQFVTEEHNAGNARKVARVTVVLPVERLRGGIALVDTPGLGALASSGAREAYAYMPRCDLGVVIVDGGGTLESSDVDLTQALVDSGIEVAVVITKADRIADADRVALGRYVREQLLGRLGIEVEAHWVSSVEPEAALARAWFDGALAPRIARARDLAAQSLARKLATLGTLVERASRQEPLQSVTDECMQTLERIGGEAARFLDSRRRSFEDMMLRSRDAALEVVRSSAAVLASSSSAPVGDVVAKTLVGRVDREREDMRRGLLEVRDKLRAWIEEAARAADVVLDRDVVSLDLTGMPVAEVPAELQGLNIEASRLLPGRERRLAEKLAQTAGPPLELALHRFEGQLREWMRATLGRLGRQFTSQIDPLRAAGRVE